MNQFIEYLQEIFVRFGPIHARKMFGGYGIYFKKTMFGLVADDVLYLKVDAELAKDFEARGLGPFEYCKGDKVVKMSYYMAPEEILDDPDEAAAWGTRSYDAALRSTSKKREKSKKRSP
ncbi:TfoX/Sxy family protein [Nitrospira sp. M1]